MHYAMQVMDKWKHSTNLPARGKTQEKCFALTTTSLFVNDLLRRRVISDVNDMVFV